MQGKDLLRAAIGVVAGLLLTSFVVEAVEFAVVTAAHGGVTTDPETYYGVRNRGWVLMLKLIYNTAGGFAGGYVAATIARQREVPAGMLLAAIQAATLVWAATNPELSRWAPAWMWGALVLTTCGGMLWGAHTRSRRVRPD